MTSETGQQIISTLVLVYFGRPRLGYTSTTNFCWSTDILSLNFYKRICIICQEKCFSCCILLTDQISSLSGCLYFLRYRAIYVLQLFVVQPVTSKILIQSFLIKLFFHITKKKKEKNLNISRTKRAFNIK